MKTKKSVGVGKFSCRGAMFLSLYLHNHTTSYIVPYSIVILYGGTTTFSLTPTPTNIPIKSNRVGLLPMVRIFGFSVWPISPPSFRFMKGDIAQMIDLLEPYLLLSYIIFPPHAHQKLSGVFDFPIGIFVTTMTPNP